MVKEFYSNDSTDITLIKSNVLVNEKSKVGSVVIRYKKMLL